MNVLLVQAYLGRKEPLGAIFPIGLCYIATALSDKKHKIQVFDTNISENPYGELEKHLIDFKPDVVGISLRNIDTTHKRDLFCYFKTVSPTVKIIKEFNNNIKVIIGGPGYSMFAEEIMERIPQIDYGVYLEGEESFPELLDNLNCAEKVKGIYIRNNGNIRFTGFRQLPDFSKLSIPRRDFIDITKYCNPLDSVGIQTKRGCPQKCIYCSYPFLNGNNIRMRNPSHIADEIEYLSKEFKIRQFFFVDGVFNIPLPHAIGICNEIIHRGLDVEWKAWCEPVKVTSEFMDLAKRSGCKGLLFSPDAISDKTLELLEKGFTEKDIIETIELARKTRGMKIGFSFFCSPPGQNMRGFLKTVFLFLKMNIIFFGRVKIALNWIRIEPHTKLYQIALKENVISKDTDLLPDNEYALSKLFYSSPSVKYGDFFVDLILDIIEHVIFAVKFLLRQPIRRRL